MTRRWAPAAASLAVALGPVAFSAAKAQLGAGAESSGALARLAEAVASQVAQAPAEPPVGVYVASESANLARSFATLVISDLAQRKLAPSPVNAPSAEAAEATARRSGARSLVRLNVAVANGSVLARGDLLSTWVNFWSGQDAARNTRPAAAIVASVEADSQALALAAAPDLRPAARRGELRLEGAKLADLPRWTAALASGDLDGDGRDEIVALTDDEIFAFSADGKLLARRDHRFLGDSATPCREPFGAISVVAQRIAYFSAARRKGELLALDRGRAEFRSLALLDDVPIAAQNGKQIWGTFVPGRSAFAANLWTESAEKWALPNPLWALSLFPASSGPRSLLVFADGTASWALGPAISRGLPLRDAAAAMALVDIDGDGEPEIITTSSRYRADPDELRVLSAPEDGRASTSPPATPSLDAGALDRAISPRELWRGPVRGGSALQVVGAKLEAGKSAQIVVGVWMPDGSGQLQVFWRVSP